jgi:flagellar hook protein FlgE
MASFATSLSGLQANSQDLSVISNNLANLNTTAYKGASAAFQDLFYQQIGTSGDGNPIQIGVGTTVGSVPANFTEGNIQSTGVPTDVAIQGSGFSSVSTTAKRYTYAPATSPFSQMEPSYPPTAR